MGTRDVVINRDEENDVLYVIKADVNKELTKNIIVDENFIVRIDPDNNNEIVGYTIENFSVVCSKLKDKKDWELMEFFDESLEFANASCRAVCKA